MRRQGCIGIAVALIGLSGSARGAAGPADFTARLRPREQQGHKGSQVQVRIEFDFRNYENQGFSIGVCTANEAVAKGASAVLGPGVMTAKCGEASQFKRLNTLATGGFTMGVVVDFDAICKIPPTNAFHAATLTYDVLGEVGQSTDLVICDTLGTPPVQTVVVVEGVSIKPGTLENARIGSVDGPRPGGELMLVPEDGGLVANGHDREDVAVMLANSFTNIALQGWSYGVSHDGAKLALVAIKGSPAAMATNSGAGPDFYAVDIAPMPGPGGTVACVISLEPPFEDIQLAAGGDVHLERFVYRSAVTLCDGESGTTSLAFNDQLGTPAVDNVLVIEGLSVEPQDLVGAHIALASFLCHGFVRGDANTDRRIDIGDGIWILNELFQPQYGNRSKCKDATDVNADGQIDASDAIYVLYYQLLDGPQPPPPFPICEFVGPVLGCDEYPCR